MLICRHYNTCYKDKLMNVSVDTVPEIEPKSNETTVIIYDSCDAILLL